MKDAINGLNFKILYQSVKNYEQRGHSLIHLNAVHRDYQVLDCKKVSPMEYVAHIRDCQNQDNYLIGLSKDRYHIIKRWKNDIQR
tara:strand:- start:317 stop:571 length:255 start_codon:yes stop_codon:yes gene_type:complete